MTTKYHKVKTCQNQRMGGHFSVVRSSLTPFTQASRCTRPSVSLFWSARRRSGKVWRARWIDLDLLAAGRIFIPKSKGLYGKIFTVAPGFQVDASVYGIQDTVFRIGILWSCKCLWYKLMNNEHTLSPTWKLCKVVLRFISNTKLLDPCCCALNLNSFYHLCFFDRCGYVNIIQHLYMIRPSQFAV